MKDQPKSEAKGFEGHIPGKRCKMNGDEIYICHIIEGNGWPVMTTRMILKDAVNAMVMMHVRISDVPLNQDLDIY